MIETSADLLRSSSATFGNIRKMFGKCLEAFVWPLEQFWKIFGNLRKSSESGRKYSENSQNVAISRFIQ